jgi:signal transduction histidine kinase/ligand-binding sensor domain-containing protein
MKNILRHYLLLSFLFIALNGAAQTSEVKFNLVTGTNGITLGNLSSITQDKYGFMWFADQTNQAIVRFDGHHMKRYQYDVKNPDGPGGFNPECLATDSLGNVWIGYYGTGLDKFNLVTGKFTHYRHDPNDEASLSHDKVAAVLVDHLGNVWVGTEGGLDLLDQKTGKFKHFVYRESDSTSLSHNVVRAIYEDKTGELWVGTGIFAGSNIGGLNHFHRESETFTRYLSDPANPNTLIDNRVKAIFEDSHGTFWVGTNGDGLHTLDRKTGLFKRHTYDHRLPEQLSRPPLTTHFGHITFITEDSDKKIWIGTWDNGLTRYDPVSRTITRYGHQEDKAKSLNGGFTWCAYVAQDGFMWLVSQESGLFKIDINNTIIPHVDMDAVINFNELGDSIGWYVTPTGLIRKDFRTGATRKFVHDPANPKSISDSRVTRIIKDKAGDFWVGTENGLNHFNVETETFTRYYHNPGSNEDEDNRVYAIYEDSDSTLWVGNLGHGLDLLNWKTGKYTNYKHDPADTNSISYNSIGALQKGEANELWITTFGGGVNKLDLGTGKFRRYLPGLRIFSIYRDAFGFIWVGSGTGLHRYDKPSDRFDLIFNEYNNNIFGAVHGLTNDRENNLWMSTDNGIFSLNKKNNQWYQYGKENGVSVENYFIDGSSFTSQNGEIYFGNKTGYYAFDPKKIKTITSTTHLYFTGFRIDNKEIIPGGEGLLKESLFQANEIILNHDQNVFSFSATTVDFRNTEDKSIFYQLENYDHDWRQARPEDQIQYKMVPPGEYLFRIKTTGNNGEWIEKSMAVIITPPWWNTWPAYMVYGLLFMASVFSVHRVQRNRVIWAERERTREREFAQAKEIEKAYTELKATQSQLIQSEKMASLGELTAGIAHEIQNPLNFVNNFSEVNRELAEELEQEIEKGNYADAKSIAQNIQENEEKIIEHGKRADAIVKGMLQHSRSSSGVKEPTDINALADEYLRLAYHGLRAKDKSFNVIFKTDFDDNIGNINIIPQDIGRVLLNLINNAFYAVDQKKKQVGEGYEPEVVVTTKLVNNQKNEQISQLANSLIISVKDNGNGIPDAIKEKIFQPFFTTKPTGQGTGLGLSLSYDIVKAHGGAISVESKESGGTEFIVTLPMITG